MNQPNGPAGHPGNLYASPHGLDPNAGYSQSPNPQATAAAALTQQSPVSDGSAANGRKRKASGTSGSRGVANLTPEQLAKKRANDREAQRAIRLRTRNTIDNLEQRIRELESQQPFQELQRVVAERDRALAECEVLKARLSQIAGIVGTGNPRLSGEFTFDDLVDPTLFNEDGAELASLTAQQTPLPPLSQHHHQPPQYVQVAQDGSSYEQQQHLHPDLRSPNTPAHDSPASQVSTSGPPYGASEGGLRKWSPRLEQQQNQQHYQPRSSQDGNHQALTAPTNGERLGLSFLLDSTQNDQANSGDQPAASDYKPSSDHQPIWARVPNNTPPAYPMDSLLYDFVTNQRHQLSAGVPMHELIGPEYPCFAALFDPSIPKKEKLHPISALLVDILSKFPGPELPENSGVLLMMFLVLRWWICPCERCYERMPEWMRPLPEQLDNPHATWIDYLAWPGMRRPLSTTVDVNFNDFFVPFTRTLSVNWPYPIDQILVPAKEEEDGVPVKINPLFESHVMDLNNWSLGTEFATAHPDLLEGVRIEDAKKREGQ